MTAKQLSVCLVEIANFIMSDESNNFHISLHYSPQFAWYIYAQPIFYDGQSIITTGRIMEDFRTRLENRCFFRECPAMLCGQYTNPDGKPFAHVIY